MNTNSKKIGYIRAYVGVVLTLVVYLFVFATTLISRSLNFFKIKYIYDIKYIGDKTKEGWSGYLPFYSFTCPVCIESHEDYPHGYDDRLNCPRGLFKYSLKVLLTPKLRDLTL